MLHLLTERPTLVLAGTFFGAVAVAWLSGRAIAVVARLARRPFLRRVHDRCHRAWLATLVTVSELIAIGPAGLPADVEQPVRHALVIATIGAVSWLAATTAFLVEDSVMHRVKVDVRDNRRARRVRTQMGIIRRLTAVVVTIVGAAAALMTFDPMRTYGASVLASAGLVGVVAGLAAQTTLSNVFAGLQLVFTDALRYDDIVVVEGQWGRIEELTLTYVVVHLWDERRLVLPATYFTTTPFENWTRSESRVIAALELYLDPSAPVGELRRKTRELVEANPLWDQREWVLQVTDVTELAMVVRITASAADASSAWDLKCDLREQLLAWVHAQHPGALPRMRTAAADARLDRELVLS
ncbi:mechanosensitive ion channel family protein [Nocardioides bizhenqiangii]|uniref:Mechanosensitive ion channel n=1 Tax=Nocardioides bizhenqiangii TaxID=3095076 RepID=A0ABZ0ZMU9_9ACTN|nr:mechanosensitive ion channel domain-containing protein [Nocardioides sp. HM61]WQQ25706.1 mechanosensitive ion channel [Nocardioides sp. HM61]